MNQTELITGASSGMGLEMSRILADNKINLLLVSRNKKKLKILAEELKDKNGIKAYILPKDLSIHKSVK